MGSADRTRISPGTPRRRKQRDADVRAGGGAGGGSSHSDGMATVLQLSDVHLADAPGGAVLERDADARLAAVLAAWERLDEPVDLVILTGDNTDGASVGAYGRLAAQLRELGAPVLAVPGNHDVASRVADAFGGETVVEVGAWRVVGLDSARPGQVHGEVDVPAAMSLLDGLDGRPTMVAIHHPPHTLSTHEWFQLDGAAELLTGLRLRPHVRIVISGHLHWPFEVRGPGDLTFLGCPSTLVAIRHDGDQYEITPDGVTGGRVLYLDDSGSFSTRIVADDPSREQPT